MKNVKLRLVLLCLAALLTLGFSHKVAQACADIDAGGTVYGDYDCRLLTPAEGGVTTVARAVISFLAIRVTMYWRKQVSR
jgi:hypothetical protein